MTSVIIDTHVLLWASHDPARLSAKAKRALKSTPKLLLSHASVWEMAIKMNKQRLSLPVQLVTFVDIAREKLGFELLPIELPHLIEVASLPRHHEDPFDRLLVCQALCLQIPIVSGDEALDQYLVQRVW